MTSLFSADSTSVLPHQPSPTMPALIILYAPATRRLRRRLDLLSGCGRSIRPRYLGHTPAGQVSTASATHASIQNTQYSMPPITQIHFLVTFQVAAPATNRWMAATTAT